MARNNNNNIIIHQETLLCHITRIRRIIPTRTRGCPRARIMILLTLSVVKWTEVTNIMMRMIIVVVVIIIHLCPLLVLRLHRCLLWNPVLLRPPSLTMLLRPWMMMMMRRSCRKHQSRPSYPKFYWNINIKANHWNLPIPRCISQRSTQQRMMMMMKIIIRRRRRSLAWKSFQLNWTNWKSMLNCVYNVSERPWPRKRLHRLHLLLLLLLLLQLHHHNNKNKNHDDHYKD
mmetsp:Transcript_24676/g.41981  ORF Transcript_24676/g.41981 Transcript_24676/m.41981 type:complete len:230 (+) Transcript_24676:2-691(+)